MQILNDNNNHKYQSCVLYLKYEYFSKSNKMCLIY